MYNQMVVDKLTSNETDRLFHALADSTRRDIVERVIVEELSVSGLASRYSMSFAAIQKHVAVLEKAALVTKTRRGREQIVQGDVSTIRAAESLLQKYRQLWLDRADRIGDLLREG